METIVSDYLQAAEAREASAKVAAVEQQKQIQEYKVRIQPIKDSFLALGQLLHKLAAQVNEQTKTGTITVCVEEDEISFRTNDFFSCRISFLEQGIGRPPLMRFENSVRSVKMVPERNGDNILWYCLEAPQSQRNTVKELAEFVFDCEKKSHRNR
jgi:hypothetical protein